MYVETAACRPSFERTLSLGSQQVRVSVRGVGDDSPLLLLNGVGASLALWDRLRSGLSRRTIAIDAPGTGASSTPLLPLSVGGHARLALSVLDRLGVDRADVLGLSFGGLVAQELARRAPGRIERLVLASTSCGWGCVPSFPPALLDLASPAHYYAQVAPRQAHRVDGLGYLYQLWAASIWSSLPWLCEVAQPTLVLAGDADLLVPHLNADIFVSLMPKARKLLVRGGGHLFLVDQAELLAPEINRFLSRREDAVMGADPRPTSTTRRTR